METIFGWDSKKKKISPLWENRTKQKSTGITKSLPLTEPEPPCKSFCFSEKYCESKTGILIIERTLESFPYVGQRQILTSRHFFRITLREKLFANNSSWVMTNSFSIKFKREIQEITIQFHKRTTQPSPYSNSRDNNPNSECNSWER